MLEFEATNYVTLEVTVCHPQDGPLYNLLFYYYYYLYMTIADAIEFN